MLMEPDSRRRNANLIGGMDPVGRSFFSLMRVQIVILLVLQFVGVYLPLVVASQTWNDAFVPHFYVTLIWSSVAAVFGFVLMKQLTIYPGKHSVTYILPCLVFSYGMVALAIFLLRTDYSRYVVGASFVTVVTWLHIDYRMREHHFLPLLAIVPGGNQHGLTDIGQARWIELSSPAIQLRAVEGVVADLNANMGERWERFIAKCVLAGIPVHDAKSVVENLTGRVQIKHLSENSFGSVLPSNFYLKMQRCLDLILAALLLPFFMLIMSVAAIAIKLESKGPVFFTQQRMGYRARIFSIHKLRSMRVDVAHGQQFTDDDDARITKVGKFMRTYRIDELPQIINIIKGEMSWIGPRPESLSLADWYASEIPFYIYRHAVRPGISGWAQVMQGNVAKIDAATIKLQFDFYYIKHFSPWLDILIVLKTVQTILSGFGSR
jgi:lipopolysaccharide/colanic/teichoic acid biosynthesis glycosyltransferase